MGFGGGSDAAELARQQEQERLANIRQGNIAINRAFRGFDDSFYKQQEEAYKQYAMPQVLQQADRTQRQMVYGLSDRGLLGGGEQTRQGNEFQRAVDQQAANVSNAAIGSAQDLKREVAQQQANLRSQLNASADPAAANQAALATSAMYTAPSVYAPIGSLFQDLLNQYALRQINQAYTAPYTGGSGAVRAALPSQTYTITNRR